ncbi:MAG: glycosyl transferase [Patescibacteria group bacterium]|nr:MAG: glycosyl transferase [Patescibacteria group bacterium]
MEKITAIIVAKNHPPYILKTISSIEDFVKEIVIVDIGIDNKLINTLKKNKKISIHKINKDIQYVELIREKVKNLAKTEYILFLDPDEVIQPKLKTLIKSNLNNYDYFKIPRKNIIFDKWIKHSRWWPDYQIRLFKKDKVFWPEIIHSQPKIIGKGLEIEADENLAIIHYNYQNLDQYLEKAQRYAKSEAQQLIKEDKIFTFKDVINKALNEFISRYFADLGYKDGIHGFILSFLQMFYYFLVYFYYLESKKFTTDENINPKEYFKQGLKQSLHWETNKSLKEKIVKKIL